MSTTEEYIASVSKVIIYIEAHYSENLMLEELSQVGGFSKYHFHRIFKSVTGKTVAVFIREVRLQNAVTKFKTDKNVTQIARESGYETHASFTKAFKQHFRLSPREFAKKIQIQKGEHMLDANIVTIDPIEVLYVRKRGAYMESADKAWKSMVEFITQKSLLGSVLVRYGISHDNPCVIEEENLRYDACVSFDTTPKPEGEVVHKTIAGGKYACFVHEGGYHRLGETFEAIGTWVVESGVTLRDEPQFQKYLNLDPTIVKEEDLRTEIYIPLH